jgi:hypothetical protein
MHDGRLVAIPHALTTLLKAVAEHFEGMANVQSLISSFVGTEYERSSTVLERAEAAFFLGDGPDP